MELEIAMERLGSKILEIHKLSKSFGDKKIIEGFSYKFVRGERVGIIGPNGAGKSTLLKLFTEELEPDSGKVVLGRNSAVLALSSGRFKIQAESACD